VNVPLLPSTTRVSHPPTLRPVLLLACACSALFAVRGHALDLVTFAGIPGPMVAALTQLAALAPGIKALVGFLGFVVALITLAALRNFSSVLFYLGLCIFAAAGLVVGGAIMGLEM
jgi:hypothetical protein